MDFDFQKFYLSAQGRVNRKQFWLWLVLPFFIIGVIMSILDGAIGTAGPQGGGLLSCLWALVSLIPAILVDIKRWHDRDKSGWWMLILFVPVIGWIWFIIELGFLKGTEGPNRFGPPVAD